LCINSRNYGSRVQKSPSVSRALSQMSPIDVILAYLNETSQYTSELVKAIVTLNSHVAVILDFNFGKDTI
jgi:hypothetical protein